MIFIGQELSDSGAHFRTNIVAAIGGKDDLIIDLYEHGDKEAIYRLIADHLKVYNERFVIYNAYEDEDFFIGFNHVFPKLKLITFFSDDAWRHANYNRYLALYSNISYITDEKHSARYDDYGVKSYNMTWSCNPDNFYPLSEEKKYDVSFVGAAYGLRIEYIRYLISEGIDVRVFGRGWGRFWSIKKHYGGILTHADMLRVFSQSKINLNFLWTSADPESSVIKGRVMELAACKGFQLSSPASDFKCNGFVDRNNIAIFDNKQGMIDKIKYYLTHEEECRTIATRAYEHVLQNHTWQQKFRDLFDCLEHIPAKARGNGRKYRIMVLVWDGVRHQIRFDDERLDILTADSKSNWQDKLADVNGVVQLSRDSSINNETLYMMVFGLVADGADIIATNFYAGSRTDSGSWIRFRDRLVERKRKLLRMLPVECLMFSSAYATGQGCKLPRDLDRLKVSYVEHPSFSIALPWYYACELRLYFGHHDDSMNRMIAYMKGLRIDKAVLLGVNKIWQRTLKNRVVM